LKLEKDIADVGGLGLLNKYDSSILQLLATVYPEYEWLPWKFPQCPRNYWDSIDNQKNFMEWAGKQLNIKEMSDWYSVSIKV
jgi:hypothetical protein